MDKVLMFVGGIWAALGAGNIIGMNWTKPGGELFLGFAVIFNFLVFIFPGLVVFGIGAVMSKKRSSASKALPADLSIEARLIQLDDLKYRGIISPDEHEARRREMLREV